MILFDYINGKTSSDKLNIRTLRKLADINSHSVIVTANTTKGNGAKRKIVIGGSLVYELILDPTETNWEKKLEIQSAQALKEYISKSNIIPKDIEHEKN